ncbi:type I-F CRISPR-associated protein Csy2 [uncultured Psychrobacter sp.]|uniref:type I-F CRISPR-associated protein Csy2 n=1 Tax=uncultured Psychrobacter sp. TaxID=259303 RepID=UPI003458F6E5
MSFIYSDKDLVGYVMIKNIRIQNANAVSSPITYGFPAITGFTGAIHALSRKIAVVDGLEDIRLDGVLIACYECQPQTYREASYKDYTFNQTRNPILKSGKTASINEEGRCHLRISLVIGVYANDFMLEDDQIAKLLQTVRFKIQQQRIAGGSVLSLDRFDPVNYVPAEDINNFSKALLPAFILMNAPKDLTSITEQLQQQNPEATALDALISTATMTHEPIDNAQGMTDWQTKSSKQGRGWLVPIPVGFQGISEIYDAGIMQNVRNPEYPSRYVEAIYSLGKWVFPHRINDLADALWYQYYDNEESLYLVTQNQEF